MYIQIPSKISNTLDININGKPKLGNALICTICISLQLKIRGKILIFQTLCPVCFFLDDHVANNCCYSVVSCDIEDSAQSVNQPVNCEDVGKPFRCSFS